jgi:rhodanese-related sulfurtransferase
MLKKNGIEEAYALEGGWAAWLGQKSPVVKGDNPK